MGVIYMWQSFDIWAKLSVICFVLAIICFVVAEIMDRRTTKATIAKLKRAAIYAYDEGYEKGYKDALSTAKPNRRKAGKNHERKNRRFIA